MTGAVVVVDGVAVAVAAVLVVEAIVEPVDDVVDGISVGGRAAAVDGALIDGNGTVPGVDATPSAGCALEHATRPTITTAVNDERRIGPRWAGLAGFRHDMDHDRTSC